MFFIRFQSGNPSLPWHTRLLLILGGIILFSTLFFFAFTFFIIGLIAVGVALVAQLFLGKSRPAPPQSKTTVYRSPSRDDDVIDI